MMNSVVRFAQKTHTYATRFRLIMAAGLTLIIALIAIAPIHSRAQTETVWAFGDSIMSGSAISKWDTSQHFRAMTLPEMVSNLNNVTVANYAVPGSVLRAHPTAPNQATLMQAVDATLASTTFRPQKVIILIGHNDFIQFADNYNLSDPNSLEHSKYAALAVDAKLYNAGVQKVVWITPYPRAPGTLASDADSLTYERRRDWYNDWLVAWLSPQNRVVDTRQLLGEKLGATNRSELANSAFYIGDGLHPNADGLAQVAQQVAGKLK